MKLQVYELRWKIFTLRDIPQSDALIRIASCIDHVLLNNEDWKKVHIDNCPKGYTFSGMYPLAKDNIYEKNQVYQITIRTIDIKLAEYFMKELPQYEDVYLKALICDIKPIYQRHISKIYSITPIVVKGEEGYWRDTLNFENFGEQIEINLLKKYAYFTGEKLEEDFLMFNYMELKNKVPIKIKYKNIHLLGDKVQLEISEHPSAQKLAYLSLGTGIGNMNQRGMGYVNVKFI